MDNPYFEDSYHGSDLLNHKFSELKDRKYGPDEFDIVHLLTMYLNLEAQKMVTDSDNKSLIERIATMEETLKSIVDLLHDLKPKHENQFSGVWFLTIFPIF